MFKKKLLINLKNKSHSWYLVIFRSRKKSSIEVAVQRWKRKPSVEDFFEAEIQTIRAEPRLNKSFKFWIKSQKQNVLLQLIMRCLHSSKDLQLSHETSNASIYNTKNTTAVTWWACCVHVIWLTFSNESAVPDLATKESVRAAVHPDEPNEFPKQFQHFFPLNS